ncbi:hypothetical protein ACGC1H_003811 [Rhizoctonia solani]
MAVLGRYQWFGKSHELTSASCKSLRPKPFVIFIKPAHYPYRILVNSMSISKGSDRGLDIALDEYLDACLARTSQSSDETSPAETRTHLANLSHPYDLIENEYSRVSFFERQIHQAQAAIGISRNSSWATVPINAIPIEVLGRIFWLVTQTDPCRLDAWSQGYERLPKYPVPLTHVCVHWRQIIIGAPSFWTHIDVTPLLCDNESLRNRIQTFVARTGDSLLDIHIISPYPTDEYWEASGLNEFLAPLTPRMRSLDLDFQLDYTAYYDAGPQAREFCSSILSNCLGNHVPGTLTQVSLKAAVEYSFLEAVENACGEYDIPVGVSASHLENIWHSVTVLRLKDLFPSWKSNAYSGLVELSLGLFSQCDTSITERCLARIMTSSPRLRVLEFGLPIVPEDIPCEGVLLSYLSSLTLQPTTISDLEVIFRLLVTSQALNQTIYAPIGNPDETYNSTVEARRFFARSKTTALHLVGIKSYLKLLELMDTPQTLTISMYSSDDANTILAHGNPGALRLERLNLLCVGRFRLEINDLLDLVRLYAPRHLLSWGIDYIDSDKDAQYRNIIQELSILGTSAKMDFSDPPYPSEYSFMSFE